MKWLGFAIMVLSGAMAVFLTWHFPWTMAGVLAVIVAVVCYADVSQ